MIVNAMVKNEAGQYKQCLFLVRFNHTPLSECSSKHRRKCECSIYPLFIDGKSATFVNPAINEQYSILKTMKHGTLCYSDLPFAYNSVKCQKEDNYVKAFGRIQSLTKALRNIIESKKCFSDINRELWYLDNKSFKDFMKELKSTAPHGWDQAMRLVNDCGYIW